MITDRFMEPGSFELQFDGVPQRVWDRLRPGNATEQSTWFNLVVSSVWNPEIAVNPSTALASSLWTGVCTRVDPIAEQLSGQGLLWHLGDSSVGQPVNMSAGTVDTTDLTLNQWISRIVSGYSGWGWPASGLLLGNVSAFGASLYEYGAVTEQHRLLTRMQLLEWLRDGPTQGLLEWRVRPNGALDVGTYLDLWSDVVSIIVQRDDRSGASSEAAFYAALQSSELAIAQSSLDTITGVVVLGADDSLGIASVASPWPNHVTHDYANRATVIDRNEVSPSWIQGIADREVATRGVTTTTVTVDGQAYDVRGVGGMSGRPSPGSLAAIYDPESLAPNTANAVLWRGSEVWPTWVRVYATKFPVVQGMGVYAHWWNGFGHQVEDLTRWLVPEDGAWSFEVGSPLPGLALG